MKRGNGDEKEVNFTGFPRAFFVGAEQRNTCGCRVHILMDEELQYFISWNGRKGTNSSAEARALAGLLAFCIYFDIQAISIFGDSKTVIDHVNGTCHIKNPHLARWMDMIMFFWGLLRGSTIQHIFWAQSQRVDNLSKEGLLLDSGAWSMKVTHGECSCFIQDFFIPDS